MTMIYIIFFTALDLLSKWIWETYRLTPIIYNPNMSFGIQANHWVKFVLPVLILPMILYFGYKIQNLRQRQVFFVLLWSGAIGNYIGRFSDKGVIDFIPFPYTTYYFNFADVYTTVLQLMIFWIVLTGMKKEESQIVRNNVLKQDDSGS